MSLKNTLSSWYKSIDNHPQGVKCQIPSKISIFGHKIAHLTPGILNIQNKRHIENKKHINNSLKNIPSLQRVRPYMRLLGVQICPPWPFVLGFWRWPA